MSTYTQIFYHIVFATKHREPVLDKPRRDDLYRLVWDAFKSVIAIFIALAGLRTTYTSSPASIPRSDWLI